MNKVITLLLVMAALLLNAQTAVVRTGIETLRENNFAALAGKRIGLITNHTAVDRDLKSTVDILFSAPGVQLTALFGPEHGVRGSYSAGDKVDSTQDPVTKLPVYSLYGKTRKPTPEMLRGLDALVYDIQDIGCRSYTYISTMGLAMEAAAENNLDFIVLDRPNPLGGERVEGNVVAEGYFSFVSQFKIPYVYGLTPGELAAMLNGEHLLNRGISCRLTVVPMQGWKRSMDFAATGLPWILTSPHVPYKETPLYYVATGVLGELGYISEGVGYTLPFQVLAAEWIDGTAMCKAMNELQMPGYRFRPITLKPYYGKNAGKTISGIQIVITDPAKAELLPLQFRFMEQHHRLYPEHNPFGGDSSRFSMFDKVCGSNYIREQFSTTMSYDSIKEFLNKDAAAFREKARQYFLY